jgi:hypothetical protein
VRAVKRAYRYLQGTRTLSITYTKNEGGAQITGYSDADWAGDKDTRKSTSGYLFMMNGGPISWRSRRQRVNALSSCESEMIALCSAVQEGLYLTQAMKQVQQNTPTIEVLTDNQATIQVVKKDAGSWGDKLKHMANRYFFVANVVKEGEIGVGYVPSEENLADCLTKALGNQIFQRIRNLMKLVLCHHKA